MDKKILVLIPARMGSSRFPGKPLAKIAGKPMIAHVYEGSLLSNKNIFTAVTTCDVEISNFIKSIGGTAIMTSHSHERATDRCAEALVSYEAEIGRKFDLVVMVQGDEPMVRSEMIEQAIEPFLADENLSVTNLMGSISSRDEFDDTNCIKVITDKKGHALYFSRSPIPYIKAGDEITAHKQVCVMGFTRNALIHFTNLTQTKMEVAESIDMLRYLENDISIKMVPTSYETFCVDTPEDLYRVEKIITSRNEKQ